MKPPKASYIYGNGKVEPKRTKKTDRKPVVCVRCRQVTPRAKLAHLLAVADGAVNDAGRCCALAAASGVAARLFAGEVLVSLSFFWPFPTTRWWLHEWVKLPPEWVILPPSGSNYPRVVQMTSEGVIYPQAGQTLP